MKCELAHERIVTGAYGELPDDQAHELDRHLAECAGCRQEREQLLAMKVLADALPVVEPGPNLVARSRLRLDEALDALPAMHWYERVVQRLMNSVAGLQAAPLAACLLLAGLSLRRIGRRTLPRQLLPLQLPRFRRQRRPRRPRNPRSRMLPVFQAL
jgi:anti-sigma factor RsiW